MLGDQVVAEINAGGGWQRGYVYLGFQLVALQDNGVYWVHQDPVTKSQRITDSAGNAISGIELDPWGGDTSRSWNQQTQPHKFTTYERDENGSDEAMHRRYNRWWSRFDQPDPYDGSYSLADPQSFNRYAYVQNDPVNFIDPTGLFEVCVVRSWQTCVTIDGETSCGPHNIYWECTDIRGNGGGHFRPVLPPPDSPPPGGPPPTPQPAPVPVQNPQQRGFDDCVRNAWRQYRKGYLKESLRGVLGGALIVGGAYVFVRGVPGATPAGGIGMTAAGRYFAIGEFEAGMAAIKGAAVAPLAPMLLGAMALNKSVDESRKNSAALDAALLECEKQFPGANHSRPLFNFSF